MEMWRVVVISKHHYDDTKESTNFRHTKQLFDFAKIRIYFEIVKNNLKNEVYESLKPSLYVNITKFISLIEKIFVFFQNDLKQNKNVETGNIIKTY